MTWCRWALVALTVTTSPGAPSAFLPNEAMPAWLVLLLDPRCSHHHEGPAHGPESAASAWASSADASSLTPMSTAQGSTAGAFDKAEKDTSKPRGPSNR